MADPQQRPEDGAGPAPRKAPAKRAATRKAADGAKKTPAKKAPVKKAPAEKAAAKKAAAKKAPAQKAPAQNGAPPPALAAPPVRPALTGPRPAELPGSRGLRIPVAVGAALTAAAAIAIWKRRRRDHSA